MCSRTNMYRNVRDCDCLFTEIPRTFMIDKVLIKIKLNCRIMNIIEAMKERRSV